MIHSFDPDIAQEVGIEAAILYHNIAYWCEKNRLNNKNEHEGTYWTYNSLQAFCLMFPYMSKGVIQRNLAKLEEKGYIKKGNFNKAGFDRTMWYTDLMPFPKNEKCISQIQNMDVSKMKNGCFKNETPIPNINTNEKQIIKECKKDGVSESFDSIMDSFEIIKTNPKIKETLFEYIKMRKLIKKPLTNRALKMNINDAIKYSDGDPVRLQEIIEQSIKRSWAGFFPIDEKKVDSKSGDFWAEAVAVARQLDDMEVQNEEGDLGLFLETSDGHVSI